jgi:hypothetical protein
VTTTAHHTNHRDSQTEKLRRSKGEQRRQSFIPLHLAPKMSQLGPHVHPAVDSTSVFKKDIFKNKVLFCTGGGSGICRVMTEAVVRLATDCQTYMSFCLTYGVISDATWSECYHCRPKVSPRSKTGDISLMLAVARNALQRQHKNSLRSLGALVLPSRLTFEIPSKFRLLFSGRSRNMAGLTLSSTVILSEFSLLESLV